MFRPGNARIRANAGADAAFRLLAGTVPMVALSCRVRNRAHPGKAWQNHANAERERLRKRSNIGSPPRNPGPGVPPLPGPGFPPLAGPRSVAGCPAYDGPNPGKGSAWAGRASVLSVHSPSAGLAPP
jgi:hypothetical protein